METRDGRRGFLGVLGAATAGALVLALGRRAEAQGPPPGAPRKGDPSRPTVTGTSKVGSLQEALDLAIQAALASAPGADRLASWRLVDVSGRQGGIARFNEVTVTIEATLG